MMTQNLDWKEKITNRQATQLKIMQGSWPKYIYRFRPDKKYTYEELGRNYVWYSSIYDYNDPFEGEIYLHVDKSGDDLKNFLTEKLAEQGHARENIDKIIEQYRDVVVFNEKLNEIKKMTFTKYGICSFTKDAKNILMWSHYASDHTGICIKYDFEKLINDETYPIEVIYSKEYPTMDWSDKDFQRLGYEAFGKKSIDWKYEKEIRLVNRNRNGSVGLERNAMVEIIFGCNCPAESIKRMKSTIESNYLLAPSFKYAKKSHDRFKLRFLNDRE